MHATRPDYVNLGPALDFCLWMASTPGRKGRHEECLARDLNLMNRFEALGFHNVVVRSNAPLSGCECLLWAVHYLSLVPPFGTPARGRVTATYRLALSLLPSAIRDGYFRLLTDGATLPGPTESRLAANDRKATPFCIVAATAASDAWVRVF